LREGTAAAREHGKLYALPVGDSEGGVMAGLSARAKALLDEPNLAFLATLNEDGSPQLSPVWIDREDETLLVNTAIGRTKDRNMRRDPRVAVSVVDREDDYRKIDVRGRVVDVRDGEEAERHIDALARKYLGEETYPWRKATERRVLFKIRPDRVHEGA
jgi:PPOX class probable F420-dependent enzyme